MKAEYSDHMGSDLSVVNAARVSFDKKSEWLLVGEGVIYKGAVIQQVYDSFVVLPQNGAKLIEFLAKHNHWTPFAHTAVSLRMTAPVPIRTQCFKHKQGLVENEESRRYISSRPELFIPEHFRSKPEGSVKQGSGGVHRLSEAWKRVYAEHCERAIDLYEMMIAAEVAPEQARFVLPQGVQVNWVWTGNLAAFARFYKQRTDEHAQGEVQELAEAVGEICRSLFPVSWDALTKDYDEEY